MGLGIVCLGIGALGLVGVIVGVLGLLDRGRAPEEDDVGVRRGGAHIAIAGGLVLAALVLAAIVVAGFGGP